MTPVLTGFFFVREHVGLCEGCIDVQRDNEQPYSLNNKIVSTCMIFPGISDWKFFSSSANVLEATWRLLLYLRHYK